MTKKILLQKFSRPFLAVLVLSIPILYFAAAFGRVSLPEVPFRAPEFTHTQSAEWINSKPLMLSDFRGKVVLLDFWTYGCWNCYHSFPWLHSVEDQYRDQGLWVIGVHTPEFDHERVLANVIEKVKEFKLKHPVMIDNDFSYWHAMRNRYWPAFYIIDKKGLVRGVFVGATYKGDKRARAIENLLDKLLLETG